MVMIRVRKRKEMAEAACCSSTPPPQKPKDIRRCIPTHNPCDSATNFVRPQPQKLKSNADKPQVCGWKVFFKPNIRPSPEPESLHPHTSSEERIRKPPRESEQDQSGNMTDETVGQHSIGIGMTEVFLSCRKSFEVDAEVESAYKSVLVTVGKYRVKEERAPILQKIFEKYGDIAEDSDPSCTESFSHFLGMVCEICEELKNTSFTEITLLQVDEMLRKVADLERLRMNVKWLRKKLNEFKEMKELVGGYNDFKEKRGNIETKKEELNKKKADLAVYQQEVKAKLVKLHQEVDMLTDELTLMKANDKHTHHKIRERKEKIIAYYNKNLVDGHF